MSALLKAKLSELIKLSEAEKQPNAQIVLLILSGAIDSGDDGLLAGIMKDIAKEILIPRIKSKQENQIASKN